MVNAWVASDRVLVAVDTLSIATQHDGANVYSRTTLLEDKLYLMPVNRLLIANRGTSNFHRLFYECCLIQGFDYDGVISHFPELLEATLGMINYEIEQSKRDPTPDFCQELWLIGWSNEHESFRGTIRYRHEGKGDQFEASDFPPGGYGNAAPFRRDWGPCPVTNFSTEDQIIELARWQMKMVKDDPEPTIGGRLQIVEMTPHAFSIKTHIELSAAPAN